MKTYLYTKLEWNKLIVCILHFLGSFISAQHGTNTLHVAFIFFSIISAIREPWDVPALSLTPTLTLTFLNVNFNGVTSELDTQWSRLDFYIKITSHLLFSVNRCSPHIVDSKENRTASCHNVPPLSRCKELTEQWVCPFSCFEWRDHLWDKRGSEVAAFNAVDHYSHCARGTIDIRLFSPLTCCVFPADFSVLFDNNALSFLTDNSHCVVYEGVIAV